MKVKGITIMVAPRLQGICVTARKCGVTREHLRYIMHGERKPSESLRRKLKSLGVTRRLDGSSI